MSQRAHSPDRLLYPPPPKIRRFSASSASTGVRRPKYSRSATGVRRSRNRHRSSRSSNTPSPERDYNYDPAFSSASTSHAADGDDPDDPDESDQDVTLTSLAAVFSGRVRGISQPTIPDARVLERKDVEEHKPLTYSSLPSTPVIPSSPTFSPSQSPLSGSVSALEAPAPPFSLWDYLREELLATDFDSHQELKWDRVSNFLHIPLAVEKIIMFGFVLCFDSFLYTFTIQPIRFVLAVSRVVVNFVTRSKKPLPPSQKADLLRTALLVLSIAVLVPLTDASKIYHSIRGQETIKLYVIFNVLEIADRLCASIGQDLLDCLFSRSNLTLLSRRVPFTAHTLQPMLFFALATVYTVVHALVMMYQLVCLNVAINSYDNALLSLLMSNQFVEIKGSVFKSFEKDNLFQITCADIVERFTLGLMLCFVAFRNLVELSGSAFDFSEGFSLPRSFGWIRGGPAGASVLWTISYPVLTVMATETLVDWLKHAFITKFNHIRPSVYERYTDVLCRDLASGSRLGARKHTYVDQSPLVARRLGFASLPLAVLTILIGSQSLSLIFDSSGSSSFFPTAVDVPGDWWELGWWVALLSHLDSAAVAHYVKWSTLGLAFWVCAVLIKILMGVNLVSFANRRREGMEAREAADVVNDFGRDPIGEGREEQKYNKELKTLLGDSRYNATPTAEIGERVPGAKEEPPKDGRKKKRYKLEELTRFTMVKRIW